MTAYQHIPLSQDSDTAAQRQGSLAIWMRIQQTVDLAHFVGAAVRIVTRAERRSLSERQQNAMAAEIIGVSGESVRQWRAGYARPAFDRLLHLIVDAADEVGGEYALLVEIYGPRQAAELWGRA